MPTVNDLIKGSLRLLGVLASGEVPTAEESNDALGALNSIIASWRIEPLMNYAILPQTFPFVAGQLAYTMGPGGNWATAQRPTQIDKLSLNYTSSGSPTITLDIDIINLDQYQAIVVPTTASSIPMKCYIDDGFPLRTLSFWPVPSVVNMVSVFMWQAISKFAAITDVIALPDGYERALRYNLAAEIAPEYGTQASATVLAAATSTKALIKSININPLYMQADNALLTHKGDFNYLTGQ